MKKIFTLFEKIKKQLTLLFLIPVFALQGCWLANMPVYVPPHVPTPPAVLDEPPAIIEQLPAAETTPALGRFTLRYEPASTLNPIRALNRDNISITSLLYEPLFVLDENLRPEPFLCESWETEDYVTYSFTIYPNIAMHDGSILNADDVSYSLRQARQRGRHRGKLHNISSVNSDGELTVTITLNSANVRFTRLLDVPIIKAESIDDDIPPGTGPYIFPNPDNLMLTRFANHRDFDDMPLSSIYLRVCTDSELTELFDQGGISLLWDDPVSSYEIRINRDHEPTFYNTTALQFLGFNASTGVLRNIDVRRAIGCAIDRQYIVDSIMSDPRSGQTLAAPAAISPTFDLYDMEWERRVMDPQLEMAALLERSGIEDYDADGFLEINDGIGGGGIDFKLNFLVNIENSHKVAAAEHIATSLGQVGFDIEVRVLPWDDFLRELENENFDIYYGEVQLGADFDFSPLLLPGDNNLNFGKTGNTGYLTIITEFLAAVTQDDVSAAGRRLCEDIRVNAPFVPILYKRYAVYYPVGVISGAAPTQSGVFYKFKDWDIDLEMLT